MGGCERKNRQNGVKSWLISKIQTSVPNFGGRIGFIHHGKGLCRSIRPPVRHGCEENPFVYH
jgi:hypothetical protein